MLNRMSHPGVPPLKLLGKDFSILVALTFGTWSFFVVGSCPWHYKVFTSIPGLYPLGTNSTPPRGCDKQKRYLQTLVKVSWGHNSLPPKLMVRTSDLLKNIITHQRLCVPLIQGLVMFISEGFLTLNQVIFGHVVYMARDSKSCWTQGAQLESPLYYLPTRSRCPFFLP